MIRTSRVVILLAGCFSASALVAADIETGSKVVPKSLNVRLRIENRLTARAADVLWPQEVHQAKGGFLWIEAPQASGWVRREDVLTPDTAAGELERRLKSQCHAIPRAALLRLRADCLRSNEKYEAAIRDYSASLQLNSSDAHAFLGRAVARNFLKKNYEQTISDCTECLRLRPNCSRAYASRGYAQAGMGRFDAAVVDYSEALRLQPDDVEVLQRRSCTRVAANDLDGAMADMNRLVEIQPVGAHYLFRAMIYLGLKQPHHAASDAKLGLWADPDNEALQFLYPMLLALTDRDDRIDPNALENPRTAAFMHFCMAAKYSADRPYEALDHLNKALAADPSGNLLLARANIHLNCQQFDQALDDANLVVQHDPNDPGALITRARCYLALRRFDEALADLNQVVRLEPGESDIHLVRGEALLSLGKYDQALVDLNRAIELDGENIGAYLARAGLYLRTRRFDLFARDCNRAVAIHLPPSILVTIKNDIQNRTTALDWRFTVSTTSTFEQESQGLAIQTWCHIYQGDYRAAAHNFWQSVRMASRVNSKASTR